eukprot:COSAG02_NODE_48_length_45421_cov_103.222100_21_plen_78_part_00
MVTEGMCVRVVCAQLIITSVLSILAAILHAQGLLSKDGPNPTNIESIVSHFQRAPSPQTAPPVLRLQAAASGAGVCR